MAGSNFCCKFGLLFSLFYIAHVSQAQPALVSPIVVEEQLLWLAGTAGVGFYRIPLLSYTPQGSLIAVCEARKEGYADFGPKFLAIRRSTDKGLTWGSMDYVLDDGSFYDGISLGAIVVDDETGSVFIMYSHCPHYDHCTVSTTYLVESTDDGKTWGEPRNISVQVGTMMFAPGPGYGIQKKYEPHVGRLIVCGHSTLRGDGMFCLLSDDHGLNWRYGGMLRGIPYNQAKKGGDFMPDECQPIELPDGTVEVNIRNEGGYHCSCRMKVRSFDGGETFPLEHLTFDEALIEPAVAAGLYYNNGVMFFSNPASTNSRSNLTLRWSYDSGTSWKDALQVWAQPSGYSTMTMLNSDPQDGEYLYMLYEKGRINQTSYEMLSFTRISLYGFN
ncbi:sialidase-1-like [Branchiostoma lanceolatum]|uniref:sialidase-1-like n=1 Tax=Branchiostoma lanceolatum TaxID=7740 RepID=UPI0034571E66